MRNHPDKSGAAAVVDEAIAEAVVEMPDAGDVVPDANVRATRAAAPMTAPAAVMRPTAAWPTAAAVPWVAAAAQAVVLVRAVVWRPVVWRPVVWRALEVGRCPPGP